MKPTTIEQTYMLSEKLGRGREVSDWEFACFTQGHHEQLSKQRLKKLSELFAGAPWLKVVLHELARLKWQKSELTQEQRGDFILEMLSEQHEGRLQ